MGAFRSKRSKLDKGTSWRATSIARFGLKPIPSAWKDSVAKGSEDAWERYYNHRINAEKRHRKFHMESDPDDYNWGSLMVKWKTNMENRKLDLLAEGCEWQWTPMLGDVIWEEYDDELRTVNYGCTVWSPYALPRAIELNHDYHRWPRHTTVEFSTEWEYRLLDFEDEDYDADDTFKLLCSNEYKDESLKLDVIKTPGLDKKTYKKLRLFLYGSSSKESEKITCSAMNFWLLLFGSMGTTDPKFKCDFYGCDIGYSWKGPNEKLRKRLYCEKAVEPGDTADPYGPFERYHPCSYDCTWLRYCILKITGNLGPVTKHYKGPSLKDAKRCNTDENGKISAYNRLLPVKNHYKSSTVQDAISHSSPDNENFHGNCGQVTNSNEYKGPTDHNVVECNSDEIETEDQSSDEESDQSDSKEQANLEQLRSLALKNLTFMQIYASIEGTYPSTKS